MIEKQNNYFILSTANTSYIFRILETGHVDHVMYGGRINNLEGLDLIPESSDLNIGTVPYYDEQHPRLFPCRLLSEYPTPWVGDSRESALTIDYCNGLETLSLLYRGYRIIKGKDLSFPAHAEADENTETLELLLEDEVIPISVTLRYTVYEENDVILRSASIKNDSDNDVTIKNAASLSIDFQFDDFDLITFDGAWARERNENRRKLMPGITVIDSKLGVTSSEHSPLIFLERPTGEAYGFNLIYSGNHREIAEVSPFGKTRIITGINPTGFEWILKCGESFETPEAIMTYASCGIDKASNSFHRFVNDFIIRGYWKHKERPILINNWEATYFSLNEDKLLKLAHKAAELGFELFVLDDGWFGERRNDRKGLGDWYVSKDVFPDGLGEFSSKIHELGLSFGLWVEPEMVNPDSDLYREHPDWAIAIPGRTPALCRHQLVLDITRKEIKDYLEERLTSIFREAAVDYVKWDMNRTITDIYSSNPEIRSNGEVMHRYVLSLYDLVSRITGKFPKVLFEACASGGNRYDLGLLCFMPQTWTSDNTDIYHRIAIQAGTLRGFPQSTMGAHVSASPGHQSLRRSLIESRFDIAAFGNLGYELDLTSLSALDQQAVKNEIGFYKRYRKIFQFGEFRPLPAQDDNEIWWSVSDGKTTIVLEVVLRNQPNTGQCDRLRIPFLHKDKIYRIRNRKMLIPKEFFGDLWQSWGKEENEDYSETVSGDILSAYGIALPPQFSGNGFLASTRPIGDNGTRMYIIEEE